MSRGGGNYTFQDTPPQYGRIYYRLKMIDNDGKSKESPIRSVILQSKNSKILVYPNPATNNLFVELESEKAEKGHLVLVDALGRIVLEKQYEVSLGQNRFVIDVTEFHEGAYILRFDTSPLNVVQKTIFITK